MRDVSALHPDLQEKLTQLQKLCKKNGITIGIGECVRTVEEQDALYAKGRTAPGSIVTNAKGSTYSSMHMWGVAADIYLKMDVDGDGEISDDAYNNTTKLFDKIGKLGKSIGLEWGGDWKSITDKPHFQLPDWGSTTKLLKEKYGTPEKFKASWSSKNTAKASSTTKASGTKKASTASKSATDAAKSKNNKYNKTYTTTTGLNLRTGAGKGKDIILTIPKGKQVTCYGYYTKSGSTIWLYVEYGKYTGFVSKDYLK